MFIVRFAFKVWQIFSQGRMRVTSSFKNCENRDSIEIKSVFFSRRDDKVTKVPIIPLEREREREMERFPIIQLTWEIMKEYISRPAPPLSRARDQKLYKQQTALQFQHNFHRISCRTYWFILWNCFCYLTVEKHFRIQIISFSMYWL